MQEIGVDVTDKIVDDIMHVADENGDGKIQFQEFKKAASRKFFDELMHKLFSIQEMQKYDADNTPLDLFDDPCHASGFSLQKKGMQDSDIMYMINVSEQVERPKDMLMFLGEYFKAVIDRTQKVYNDNKDEKESQKQQVDFFITYEIMNSLGTACKMYIDRQRQELRMSIALSRSPVF